MVTSVVLAGVAAGVVAASNPAFQHEGIQARVITVVIAAAVVFAVAAILLRVTRGDGRARRRGGRRSRGPVSRYPGYEQEY
jgi:ABC-type uncharacterized transport system permease subunit